MKTLGRTIIFLSGFAVCALLVGCAEQKSASAANSVSYGITTQPDHLDPFQAASADARFVLFNVFEGLLKPSPDGTLSPAVAESFAVSDDAKTYTVKLRKGVTFHNQKQVTADDVVYSLNKAREYKLPAVSNIASVEKADSETVVIGLSDADSEFYYNLTTAIVPENYDNHNSAPIGTGPFKVASFKPQVELVLVKHAAYWNPALPRLDRLVFKIKSSYNTVMLDLRAGSLDAGTIDSASLLQLGEEGFNVAYDNSNMTQMLALNNAVPPLNDVRVRQAISYVVDAQEIIALAHNGAAVRSASPVIPALKRAYNDQLDGAYAKDIARAKRLLSDAGYAAGFPLEITVSTVYQPHIDTAQVIVNQLAEIGIRASIKQVDWATWLSETYTARNYQATVISVDGATLSPRSYLFRYQSSSSSNFVNYKNAQYDELFHKTLSAQDGKERMLQYKELQRILSDDAASVFICDVSAPRVFKKGVEGFTPYPISVLDGASLDISEYIAETR